MKNNIEGRTKNTKSLKSYRIPGTNILVEEVAKDEMEKLWKQIDNTNF